MKKLFFLISIIVIIFFIFVFLTFLPKNYKYEYKINKINIIESYNKKDSIYYFKIINSKKDIYEYSLQHKYLRKRGLINSLKIKNSCIKANSKVLASFSICKDRDDYSTNYYNYEDISKRIDNFENIDIYNLLSNKYFIWNYSNFLAISNNEYKKINLFASDMYEIDLIAKLKDYLVIADYSQKYIFKKLYLINSKNNKVKEAKLDRNIYYNSYILGTYKNNIYLYDLEKELEYKINPFKAEVSKNPYEILINNSWQKVSINKLNKKNLQFLNQTKFHYEIQGNILYYITANIKIKVVNIPVSRIVQSNEKEAFFISEDSLYFVDIDKGITKIMKYSEWNFNNKYIYIF